MPVFLKITFLILLLLISGCNNVRKGYIVYKYHQEYVSNILYLPTYGADGMMNGMSQTDISTPECFTIAIANNDKQSSYCVSERLFNRLKQNDFIDIDSIK